MNMYPWSELEDVPCLVIAAIFCANHQVKVVVGHVDGRQAEAAARLHGCMAAARNAAPEKTLA